MKIPDLKRGVELPQLMICGQIEFLEALKKHNKTFDEGIEQLKNILKILNNHETRELQEGDPM